MKLTYPILIVFTLWLSGCSFITDFNDDSSNNSNNSNNINNVNNVNNINNSNNNNIESEICDNGVDDNGDGFIDCESPDCAEDGACACLIYDVFWNSPKRCGANEECSPVLVLGGSMREECKSMDEINYDEPLPYYKECLTGQVCPRGSICVSDNVYGANHCVPVCSYNHSACPPQSDYEGLITTCAVDGETPENRRDDLTYCLGVNCNPLILPNGNCFDGYACYIIDNGFPICLISGSKGEDEACEVFKVNECAPSLQCSPNVAGSSNGRCKRLCVNEDDCESTLESCHMFSSNFGFCKVIGG